MEMTTTGILIIARDRKGLMRDISGLITSHGANITYTQQVLKDDKASIYFEIEEAEDKEKLSSEIRSSEGVEQVIICKPFGEVYGKRVIVFGGGAQVAQVAMGAISEADRHNLRGEKISVDTAPLVGEDELAEAVRAVGRLHRAEILVLAGSLMGGKIAEAVKELREEHNIPVISLNMAGSVPEVCDLVVSDPVQAGVMAVLAIAETAKFDLKKLKTKKF